MRQAANELASQKENQQPRLQSHQEADGTGARFRRRQAAPLRERHHSPPTDVDVGVSQGGRQGLVSPPLGGIHVD